MLGPLKRIVDNSIVRYLKDEPSPRPTPTPRPAPSPGPVDSFEPVPAPRTTPCPHPGPAPSNASTGGPNCPDPAPLTPPSTDPKNPTPKMQVRPARSDRYDESRNGTDIDTIVLHHTADKSDKSSLETLTGEGGGLIGEATRWAKEKKNGGKVSAHYVIGKDGTIYHLVADEKRAWHAGGGAVHGDKSKDVNDRSIGIEIVNDGDGKDGYTEEQYKALEQLVPYLSKRYDVPTKNVVGHKETNPDKKDPSENFDFGRITRATEKVR
ncbi:N-acetylmuramoyl-L-alanine amidase [Myxococcus sp. CA056]|uniref:N-acetylmuramoyl-L-alanine amidase n=1 Tax=unclassified Myxococcus TaxID=2648731 RepID=UPI00157B36C6|nr:MULTISPECIES: peptidoglycan recognition family protein [unclassified Myxococcus]NTX17401.1 N-acetylmuramoyl-L-alanine amidase [Myxococcus sp. CA056]NTX52078.1 N-acetylmuramoyl-L-alanine amidase [Myxococcus sp. CA039A]